MSFLQLILDKLITQTNRSDLTKLDRVKYEALITIHIHQVDIFKDIHKMGIKVSDQGRFEPNGSSGLAGYVGHSVTLVYLDIWVTRRP